MVAHAYLGGRGRHCEFQVSLVYRASFRKKKKIIFLGAGDMAKQLSMLCCSCRSSSLACTSQFATIYVTPDSGDPIPSVHISVHTYVKAKH